MSTFARNLYMTLSVDMLFCERGIVMFLTLSKSARKYEGITNSN
jgi:hypothetical protein